MSQNEPNIDNSIPIPAPKIRSYTKPMPQGAREFKKQVGCVMVDWCEWTSARGQFMDAEVITGRDGSKRIKLLSVAGPQEPAPPVRPGQPAANRDVELSDCTKAALRTFMRMSLEKALPGIAAIALDDPDARNRIKAVELLARYGIGERVEVDQNVAPAIVLMIAKTPQDAGWPSMVDVAPEEPKPPVLDRDPQAPCNTEEK